MKLSEDNMLFIEETESEVIIGLSEQAQDDLGEITFVSLPNVGEVLEKEESFVEVEAEKAVNEFVSPIAGVVIKRNDDALEDPSLLNKKGAWLIHLKK